MRFWYYTSGPHPAEISACKRSANEKEHTILGGKTDTSAAEAPSLALLCRQRNSNDCPALAKISVLLKNTGLSAGC